MGMRWRRTGRGTTAAAAAVVTVGLVWGAPVASGAATPTGGAATSTTSAGPATADPLTASRPGTGEDSRAFRGGLDAVADAGAVGVVGAVRGPGTRWSGAAGVRSIDAAVPARGADRARVGSVTKSMIATLALQEVQAHRWTLSTTVEQVWPGLLPGHGQVTLEQLLSHRSGAPEYLTPVIESAQTPAQLVTILSGRYTDRRLVRAALTQGWEFPPGTQFSYSNTNYLVIGLMLTRANHRSLGALLERRVFRPAHMRSAVFPTRSWPAARALSGYALFERPYNLDRTSPTLLTAAGAVVANTGDLDRFYRALLTGRLLRADLVRSMIRPRSTGTLAYGLGIYAVADPCPTRSGGAQLLYGHDGATFGTQTLAFTSADGTRQTSIAWTGRSYLEESPTSALAQQFLVDAFTATCPRPVTSSAKKSTARELAELPAADRLAPLPRLAE